MEGGVHIRFSDGEAHITTALGKYSANFKAEAEAPQQVAAEIRDNLPWTKFNLAIFTHDLSVLSKLQNPSQKYLNEAKSALVDLAAQTNLTLLWIPAH